MEGEVKKHIFYVELFNIYSNYVIHAQFWTLSNYDYNMTNGLDFQ